MLLFKEKGYLLFQIDVKLTFFWYEQQNLLKFNYKTELNFGNAI